MDTKRLILIIGAILILASGIFFFTNYLKKGDSIENKLKVAKIYIENEDYESAKKIIEQILFNNPENTEAIELLKKVTQLEKSKPDNKTETKKDVEIVETKKPEKKQEKSKTLEKKEVVVEKPSVDEKTQKYEQLIAEGIKEYENKNFLKAVEYFKEATKYKEDYYKAYKLIAKSYYELSDQSDEYLNDTIEYGEKTIKYKKDDIESYILIANSYYKKKI